MDARTPEALLYKSLSFEELFLHCGDARFNFHIDDIVFLSEDKATDGRVWVLSGNAGTFAAYSLKPFVAEGRTIREALETWYHDIHESLNNWEPNLKEDSFPYKGYADGLRKM